jgi:peptidoglycan/xylan/chitin deacetylase (PgdA/CDA1 family)
VTATFILSLDTELIWGSFDHVTDDAFEAAYPDVRGTIERMLDILDRYEVPATWAVVGHLLLESCARGPDGRPHHDMPRPSFDWYPHDWYDRDPCTERVTAPLWYGRDIVQGIAGRGVGHEIGSHGFSHAPFIESMMPGAVARAELDACIAASAELGFRPTSLAFPRNHEGHLDVLAESGFTAFRGSDPTWHRDLHGAVGRAAHVLDQVAAIPPPVSTPIEERPGLWNIPGSMLFLHRLGIRRRIPMVSRVTKARLGLRRAVREDKIFHLWTHPFNLAHDRPAMLGGFEAIIRDAAQLRAAGRITIATMGAVAAALSAELPPNLL